MLLEIDFNEVILKMLLVYFGPNKKSFSNIVEMCQICTTGDMDKGVRMNLS